MKYLFPLLVFVSTLISIPTVSACESKEECLKKIQKNNPLYGARQGSQSIELLSKRNAISREILSIYSKAEFDDFVDKKYGYLIDAEVEEMIMNHFSTLSVEERKTLLSEENQRGYISEFVSKAEPIVMDKVKDWFRRDYPNTQWGVTPGTETSANIALGNGGAKYQNNLYFKGFKCRVDCSGHQAGFDWAALKRMKSESDCYSNISRFNHLDSQSFYEGCVAFTLEY